MITFTVRFCVWTVCSLWVTYGAADTNQPDRSRTDGKSALGTDSVSCRVSGKPRLAAIWLTDIDPIPGILLLLNRLVSEQTHADWVQL